LSSRTFAVDRRVFSSATAQGLMGRGMPSERTLSKRSSDSALPSPPPPPPNYRASGFVQWRIASVVTASSDGGDWGMSGRADRVEATGSPVPMKRA
jgi:hypothetical protein